MTAAGRPRGPGPGRSRHLRSSAASTAGIAAIVLLPGVVASLLGQVGVHLVADAAFVKVGVLTGLTYALLGAGLVLVHRATRVLNLAHAQIGALGAAVLVKLVIDAHWSFFLAAPVALLAGGAVGAVVELTVIRRLFSAPRLILLVATIGVAELLLALQAGPLSLDHPGEASFPVAVGASLSIGRLFVRGEDILVIAAVPVLVIGLGLLLTRTPYGLDIQACAQNPDAARLAGISVRRVSTLVWVVAALLATAAAILTGPYHLIAVTPAEAVDQGLLLKALAAAMVGRLVSLPLTLVGGVGVGVVEALVRANVPDPEWVDVLLFIGVLALVLIRARAADEPAGAHAIAPRLRGAPAAPAAAGRLGGWMRRLPLIAGAMGLLVALSLPIVLPSPSRVFLFTEVLIYSLIGLSVTLVTGWAGQLSLGQAAFAVVAAAMMAALTLHGLPFDIALAYATLAGAALALVVGLPALRVRGLFLAITTLAFAIAASAAVAVLLRRPGVLSDSTAMTVRRPRLGPVDLADQRSYYLLCLGFLVAAAAAVSRLRRSGVGRTLIAVRDNETNAAACTVSPARAKLTAFAVSGGLAALGGALLAGLEVNFGTAIVPADESLRIIAMTVIGGLGSVTGTLLGAAYVLGVPALFDNALEERLITSGAGLLIMLLYVPGGFIGLLHQGRDALLRASAGRRAAGETAGRRGVTAPAAPAPPNRRPPRGVEPDRPARGGGASPAVRVSDVTVTFGGRRALDGVSLSLERGETLGLIGTNGAGKTTLMNVISGFIPAIGAVEILGRNVSGVGAVGRARAGLGRGFQDARLFPGLTVFECIEVALEARERSELLPSMLALPPSIRAERRKRAEAAELLAFLGLGPWADHLVEELSTGVRRIAELACLMGLEPAVLLLDEPAAGIAQREVEALGPLIAGIRAELGASVLVIEHDIPLVLSISDRLCCLEAGRVIADGDPAAVRADPRVISSHLGTGGPVAGRGGAVPA